MNDQELLRYSRQILLPELGIEGQQRLRDAHALVVGVGGLGSPVALYLAAAGVGRLTLIDDDAVDLSNLQRQIVHDTTTIGHAKVDSAATRLAAINPECAVTPLARRLDEDELAERIAGADLVLDCSDNFATRFAVNRAAHATRTPLVSGAAIRWEGQVAVFSWGEDEACYRCLYDEAGGEDERCSENGVAAPLVGVIGSLQALEALKLLTAAGEPPRNRLLLFDGLRSQWRELRLRRDPACPVCGTP